ncbi:hypothetical protein Rsub_11368 [Raphidocelis subcapitata]|uniref:Cytochrome b5 domain-containing protein 1 n=1 Tax=Raphidocelis subcapitata TaxID=307507 RepID=A0A2V0PG70_9CHLO|nr:hypothetical protein Rsub_11368 [Raphidocelis subcapitata]|eukprot:GBF98786.1 hypothetical protein Rsub_11368 [Raphidocelis subcapitata]
MAPPRAALGRSSGRRQRYYTPQEVSMHNTPNDCWVSFLGGVYDLTRVLKASGKWVGLQIESCSVSTAQRQQRRLRRRFDPATGDVRTYVHPDTQLRVPYCPQGEFVHLSPMWPCTEVDCGGQQPWWRDPLLRVGTLSDATRVVRIKNVLTGQEDALEVPGEEVVAEVQQRYLAANAHAGSYAWKALVRRGGAPSAPLEWAELDLNKTLDANGLPDERAAYEAAGLPGDEAVPVLHVYWCDDLTVA